MYQTAKIAKLLLIIDKGEAYKYKGKELQDIKVEETDCLDIEKTEIQDGTYSIFSIIFNYLFNYLYYYLGHMETLQNVTQNACISRCKNEQEIDLHEDSKTNEALSQNKRKKVATNSDEVRDEVKGRETRNGKTEMNISK